ncbi:intradiol ring-cleavage dioxygenase [Acuticoccus sediminis]|uniref:Intradiol ring-cleavage dioxygenase n=1 Tax=Acuticoccus sediminis TaxID=2184697 RepID=A0A8B2NQH9_9HYPH|nr:intradiol ring-cleavage dioxygenase [Acuticoccus sediminis]RAI02136.1 intradiol ring-cleavage dioxygenase [Acuticoccus sediminis]
MRSRRELLQIFAAGTGLAAIPGAARAQSEPLEPTPSCGATGATTPTATAGPYFRPGSPERTDVTEGRASGTPILIGGRVLDRDCRPLRRALVDLWQADEDGRYDTTGTYLRGHQYTDGDGRWAFATIVPAPYTFRSMHIHFRVQRPGGDVLTTQVFFPGDPSHDRDRQFDPRLLLALSRADATRVGRFDFVLA